MGLSHALFKRRHNVRKEKHKMAVSREHIAMTLYNNYVLSSDNVFCDFGDVPVKTLSLVV